jgi:phage-related protein
MKFGNLENVILPNFIEFLHSTLDKKTNKTSRHEIEKAKRSMNKYVEQKKDKIGYSQG